MVGSATAKTAPPPERLENRKGKGQLRIGGNSASAERTGAIRSTSSSATDQGSSFQLRERTRAGES